MSAHVGGRGIIICKLYARYFVSRSVKVTELTVSFLPDYTHTDLPYPYYGVVDDQREKRIEDVKVNRKGK